MNLDMTKERLHKLSQLGKKSNVSDLFNEKEYVSTILSILVAQKKWDEDPDDTVIKADKWFMDCLTRARMTYHSWQFVKEDDGETNDVERALAGIDDKCL